VPACVLHWSISIFVPFKWDDCYTQGQRSTACAQWFTPEAHVESAADEPPCHRCGGLGVRVGRQQFCTGTAQNNIGMAWPLHGTV